MRKIVLFIIVLYSLLSAQMSSPTINKLQSLILPGLGELNMGHEKRARSFFIREAAIWLVWIGGTKASNWYKSDYQAFAELHAGVDMDGKDYIFAVNMGHYNSFTEYNETKARQREVHEIYEEGKGNEWQWDNKQNRIHFDKMRKQSVTYEKFSRFAIGGLVLHRLISLIDVIYLERQYPNISLMPKLSTNTGDIQLQLNFNL